jgi:hypothetical protein
MGLFMLSVSLSNTKTLIVLAVLAGTHVETMVASGAKATDTGIEAVIDYRLLPELCTQPVVRPALDAV